MLSEDTARELIKEFRELKEILSADISKPISEDKEKIEDGFFYTTEQLSKLTNINPNTLRGYTNKYENPHPAWDTGLLKWNGTLWNEVYVARKLKWNKGSQKYKTEGIRGRKPKRFQQEKREISFVN